MRRRAGLASTPLLVTATRNRSGRTTASSNGDVSFHASLISSFVAVSVIVVVIVNLAWDDRQSNRTVILNPNVTVEQQLEEVANCTTEVDELLSQSQDDIVLLLMTVSNDTLTKGVLDPDGPGYVPNGCSGQSCIVTSEPSLLFIESDPAEWAIWQTGGAGLNPATTTVNITQTGSYLIGIYFNGRLRNSGTTQTDLRLYDVNGMLLSTLRIRRWISNASGNTVFKTFYAPVEITEPGTMASITHGSVPTAGFILDTTFMFVIKNQ